MQRMGATLSKTSNLAGIYFGRKRGENLKVSLQPKREKCDSKPNKSSGRSGPIEEIQKSPYETENGKRGPSCSGAGLMSSGGGEGEARNITTCDCASEKTRQIKWHCIGN